MSLASPALLALLALEGVVVLLYFLRAFRQTHEVSTLFLWEGVRSDPQTRAARLARRIDLLLVLQLLIVAFLVLALAGPGLRARAARVSGLAIVLDASASMQTRTPSGASRYDLAVDGARELLSTYPTSPVTLIQFSTSPRTLVGLDADRDAVIQALDHARPGDDGNGTPEMLQGLLSASAPLERVVYFSDQPLSTPIAGVEERLVSGGENAGIVAFAVRDNPGSSGVTAFVRVRNDTAAYAERTLRVTDSTAAVETALLLPPNAEQAYALPFNATSDAFTAALTPRDAFAADDTRYVTPAHDAPLRVRWIGTANRYLEAALHAAGDMLLVGQDEAGPADLTVAYGVALPAAPTGPLLLVHAGLVGVVSLGEEIDGGAVEAAALDDPILAGVDPLDFRVRSIPRLDSLAPGKTLLETAGMPFLWRSDRAGPRVVLIASDLMATNLPLTVDFPLLVRNILDELVDLPARGNADWAIVGRSVSLSGRGTVLRVADPRGGTVSAEGIRAFLPRTAGLHTVTTDDGSYLLAVNVDPAESSPATPSLPGAAAAVPEPLEAQVVLPIWPMLVVAVILLLLLEAARYHGLRPWRAR